MAIDQNIMYIQKAHRLSLYDVAPNVTEVHAGQFFHLDDNGEWTYADGTRKAYPTLNNRFAGAGLGSQGERLEGRDDISRTGKITCLVGGYEIGTDVYDDTQTFEHGSALVVVAGGKLSPAAGSAGEIVVGYVTQAPKQAGDYLRFHGA